MINPERLSRFFTDLVRIDSVSREEKHISDHLQAMLTDLGATLSVDGAAQAVGGNAGNLVARFPGTVDVPPMMLCGHMDTVEPGRGVVPVFENGIFRSQGNTILGADDKSALAIILEILHVIRENNLPHGPLEVVFTVCEEIGLMGAKHVDISLIASRFGYILDATDRKAIVARAPWSTHFEIRVTGKAAHAGAEPEKGVSAILLMSRALADLTWGRIDSETTCNVGTIKGGVATNIVAEEAAIVGEVRSHSKEKMDGIIEDIRQSFERVIEGAARTSPVPGRPTFVMTTHLDFPGTNIPDDHPVIRLAMEAARDLGIDLKTVTSGGGADANIFSGMGIETGVLGTGMMAAHTLEECIALDDMVNTAALLLACVRRHAGDL